MIVNAQNNFKQGYIITNTNDSVVGLIDFRTDGINSQVCRFKANEKAPIQLFYPGSVDRYRFINEGKYYVSHLITINNETQQVFLEYLINGMMNLYYYKKPNYEHEYYFFEDENGNLFPITKKPDEVVNMKLVSDQRYIGALGYLFNDYPSIKEKLNSTVYDRGSMIRLAKEFHELTCTSGEGCINFENDYKKSYIFIKYSIYGGMQVHNYTFDREPLRIYESATSLTPVIGGQLQVSSPRWIKYLSLMADLSFFGIRGEREYISPGNTSYRKFKFDTFTSSLRINALFTYGLGKFRPVIEGGLCSYVNAIKNSTLYTETNTIPIISETSYNYELPETIFMGVNYGAGFDYLIGNDRFLFCRISFEQVYSGDAIKSTQLKLGITF
jgi:hypothetical protein